MFRKNGVLKNFAKFTTKRLRQGPSRAEANNLIKKEAVAQMFSCDFCEIFKNSFFYRTRPVAASVLRVSPCSRTRCKAFCK